MNCASEKFCDMNCLALTFMKNRQPLTEKIALFFGMCFGEIKMVDLSSVIALHCVMCQVSQTRTWKYDCRGVILAALRCAQLTKSESSPRPLVLETIAIAYHYIG